MYKMKFFWESRSLQMATVAVSLLLLIHPACALISEDVDQVMAAYGSPVEASHSEPPWLAFYVKDMKIVVTFWNSRSQGSGNGVASIHLTVGSIAAI